MQVNLDSSAPHIYPASQWRHASRNNDLFLLHRTSDGAVEVGILRWPDDSPFQSGCDTLCYVFHGEGIFHRDNGESIAVSPGTLVHFKQGWQGTLAVSTPVEASYIQCDGGPSDKTPVLRDVLTATPLKDWGAVPTMLQGHATTAGILLSREASGRAESGIWTCTPGVWQCEVTRDEYCHFLDGSCTYTHESGECIDIEPDTLAFFPKSWKGPCEVRRTMRKVYMIR